MEEGKKAKLCAFLQACQVGYRQVIMCAGKKCCQAFLWTKLPLSISTLTIQRSSGSPFSLPYLDEL